MAEDSQDYKKMLDLIGFPVFKVNNTTNELIYSNGYNEIPFLDTIESKKDGLIKIGDNWYQVVRTPLDNNETMIRFEIVTSYICQISKGMHDDLTGLLNRSGMRCQLDNALENPNTKTIAFAMSDIDFFKNINDTYGHDVGDGVLKEVANILSSIQNSNTIVVRYGGEEFLTIFINQEIDNIIDTLVQMTSRLRNTEINVGGHKMTVTMSTGVASSDIDDLVSISSLIKEADKAMYSVKHNGRDGVVFAYQDKKKRIHK